MVQIRALWAVVLLLLVSGCAGAAKKAEPTMMTSAPPATASAGLGSIAGSVLDEEDVPIVGADVGLLSTESQAKTDDAGRFTFNDIQPGNYDLAVSHLGYAPIVQKIDVKSDEVAPASIHLKRFVVPLTPVLRTLTFTGFLQCSYNPYYFVNPCGNTLGENKDHFRFQLDTDLPFKQILLELTWKPTSAASGQELELDFCLPPDDAASPMAGCMVRDLGAEFYEYESGEPPINITMTEDQVPWKEHQTYEAWVGNGLQSPTPSLQQSFTLYVTNCYAVACPKGTTALPIA